MKCIKIDTHTHTQRKIHAFDEILIFFLVREIIYIKTKQTKNYQKNLNKKYYQKELK